MKSSYKQAVQVMQAVRLSTTLTGSLRASFYLQPQQTIVAIWRPRTMYDRTRTVVILCWQASCAVTGDGLQEGLQWVGQRVKPDAI